ncbi:uncharacterized protein N7482_006421 [Penicillium canariense]|uniref:ABC transporter domain-containing protein n=1 Tax=Penicillium canariense TaxID=189055 RepID=A0A9W9HXU0_9EURO|nr:uncharacterized protein N7482_006421 [Penicillium canariense]KAJ5159417.1 hypothetical protein N7482_006421 [Penicillium canariense]
MLLRTTLRSRALRPAGFRAVRFTSSAPLIRIEDGTFYKQYPTGDDAATNPPLYPNFNFTLASNKSLASKRQPSLQHWAVIGPSGRTDLLDILRGQHISIPPTARSYPYLLSDEIAAKDPQLRFVGNAIQYIGFSGEGSGAIGGTRGAYLSARYESHREETDWTVEQFLRGQTSLNPMKGEEKGTLHDERLLQEVIIDLHLESLLDMPIANLSNGQTRRARIAKALLKKPELLLLDEPFMGLDPATVRSISGLLHRLAEKSSPRLVLALRPQDKVPEWISHIILVGNAHQVLQQGTKGDIDATLRAWQEMPMKLNRAPKNPEKQKIWSQFHAQIKSGNLDEQLLQDFTLNRTKKSSRHGPAPLGGEVLIEMDGVCVQYGDKAVLGDWQQKVNGETKDGLHWRVRRGQRWAILGANGSGKTTLLSLITSDHPQTYALPIKLFGRSRLPEAGKPGLSIFELQSRLGHSSPEIHAFFPRQLTVREALESAFAETFLSKPTLDHERDLDVSAALRAFKAELDPNASHEEPPEVSTNTKMFPKLDALDGARKSAKSANKYMPLEHEVEYADHITFGQLSTAQQRIVLFLRALIHKPDIVILDEAFSGLTASQRDKCLQFIEHGETPRNSPIPGDIPLRHRGLSEDQALVLISHVKEEIPDSVRYYMRLPSDLGDGAEPVDFRAGMLKDSSVLSDPEIWDLVWSPPKRFVQGSHMATVEQKSELMDNVDVERFGYYTI